MDVYAISDKSQERGFYIKWWVRVSKVFLTAGIQREFIDFDIKVISQ
jgi:hypothetical protein